MKQNQEELNHAFEKKIRKKIFDPVKRFLSNPATASDQFQEGLAATWLTYHRYTSKGVVLDDALLIIKCRWVATDLNRRFAGTVGASCTNQDVLDPRAYRDGHALVYRLDGIDKESGENNRSMEIQFAEAMTASPEEIINSALDLTIWLQKLSSQDQLIIALKYAGLNAVEIARQLKCSYYSIQKQERFLGYELAKRAGISIRKSSARSHSLVSNNTETNNFIKE